MGKKQVIVALLYNLSSTPCSKFDRFRRALLIYVLCKSSCGALRGGPAFRTVVRYLGKGICQPCEGP